MKKYLNKFTKLIEVIFYFGIFILCVYLGYLIFQFSQVRYFDIDEFAHLRWAHNFHLGLKPYTEFFYFFPPFYSKILSFLFKVKSGVDLLLLARGFSAFIYILSGAVLFILTKGLANTRTAVLAMLIFLALPIPSDKWIEIRPDGLAMLLSLSGLWLISKGIKSGRKYFFFLSGLVFTMGLFSVPKIIFYFLSVVFFLVLADIINSKLHARVTLKRVASVAFTKRTVLFILGSILPAFYFLWVLASSGDFSKAIYLTFQVSADATRALGQKFPIPWKFFFYPNDIYYGVPGASIVWLENRLVWISAIVWTPIFLVLSFWRKNKNERLLCLLIGMIFILNIWAYIYWLPLKHGQYLMTLSPLVAFLAADMIVRISSVLRFRIVSLLVVGFCVYYIFSAGRAMYETKISWPGFFRGHYEKLFAMFEKGEYVFDLTGETLFTREGYYFCCIPYGQYDEVLTFNYPDLEKTLRERKVKYIYSQTPDRIGVLPLLHQKTVRDYYVSLPPQVGSYLYVSGSSMQFMEGEEKTVDLIAAGSYTFVFNGVELTSEQLPRIVNLDGKTVLSSPLYLLEGKHTIRVFQEGELTIRIKV